MKPSNTQLSGARCPRYAKTRRSVPNVCAAKAHSMKNNSIPYRSKAMTIAEQWHQVSLPVPTVGQAGREQKCLKIMKGGHINTSREMETGLNRTKTNLTGQISAVTKANCSNTPRWTSFCKQTTSCQHPIFHGVKDLTCRGDCVEENFLCNRNLQVVFAHSTSDQSLDNEAHEANALPQRPKFPTKAWPRNRSKPWPTANIESPAPKAW